VMFTRFFTGDSLLIWISRLELSTSSGNELQSAGRQDSSVR
jgi:hypothetical protein